MPLYLFLQLMTLQHIFQPFYVLRLLRLSGEICCWWRRQCHLSLCPPAEDIVNLRQNISNSQQIFYIMELYSGVTIAGRTKQRIINVVNVKIFLSN